MGWMKWLALFAAIAALLVTGLMAYGSRRWSEKRTTLLARLEAALVPHAVARALTRVSYRACLHRYSATSGRP
ncbi:MAG: hypothetical protein LH480_00345 [Rubrivivax sp.]|nr:hypothetical protein [Rubrivivax sp.]